MTRKASDPILTPAFNGVASAVKVAADVLVVPEGCVAAVAVDELEYEEMEVEAFTDKLGVFG